MMQQVKKDRMAVQQIKKVAEGEMAAVIKANSQIRAAEQLEKKSEETKDMAARNLTYAKSLNYSAETMASVAKNQRQQMELREKAAKEMKSAAKGKPGAKAIEALLHEQMDAADFDDKQEKKSLEREKALIRKSSETKANAAKTMTRAREMKEEARKQKAAAQAVKDDINSEAKVSTLRAETLKAILGAAQQELAAADTTQSTMELEGAITKALKQLFDINIQGTVAMKKAHMGEATPAGKKALEDRGHIVQRHGAGLVEERGVASTKERTCWAISAPCSS